MNFNLVNASAWQLMTASQTDMKFTLILYTLEIVLNIYSTVLKFHSNNVLLLFQHWVRFKIDLPHTVFNFSVAMVLKSAFQHLPTYTHQNFAFRNMYVKRILVFDVEPKAKLTGFQTRITYTEKISLRQVPPPSPLKKCFFHRKSWKLSQEATTTYRCYLNFKI